MSTKKDMRRADLIIPYQTPAAKKDGSADLTSTMNSTMPMAAMFMRNKYIGWVSVIISLIGWLGESEERRQTASQPAYLTMGMSLLSLVVTYLPLFMPPPAGRAGAPSGTEAAPAQPLA